MSSMRNRNRPPASRAARHPSSAERTCPRCRYPVGLGANRVTTTSALIALVLAGADDTRAADRLCLPTWRIDPAGGRRDADPIDRTEPSAFVRRQTAP